jgi:NADPH-dependent 2,4-dienoyl-CoA reductase/sulfur reductase-like enzyme
MGEYVPTSGMEEHVDLVVVGGGPTGLLSALLARRLGLTVSIVGESLLGFPLRVCDG